MRDAVGNVYHRLGDNDITSFVCDGHCNGCHNLLKRTETLDKTNNILVNGTLLVDFELQIVDSTSKGKASRYHPSNPFVDNMLKPLKMKTVQTHHSRSKIPLFRHTS